VEYRLEMRTSNTGLSEHRHLKSGHEFTMLRTAKTDVPPRVPGGICHAPEPVGLGFRSVSLLSATPEDS